MIDIKATIARHQAVISQLEPLIPVITTAAQTITAALKGGGKVLLMGNGGSAADSQH